MRGISSAGAATTPKGEGWKKLRRKGRMAADGADAPGTPRSPTVYDWCVPQLASELTVTAPSQKSCLRIHDTWHVWPHKSLKILTCLVDANYNG